MSPEPSPRPHTSLRRWLCLFAALTSLTACAGSAGGRDARTAGNEPAGRATPGVTVLMATVSTKEDPLSSDIRLEDDQGRPLVELPAGSYEIRVVDYSPIHNFRLRGPGVDKATSVSAVETVTWNVDLASGDYYFVCDPHTYMTGDLTVI